MRVNFLAGSLQDYSDWMATTYTYITTGWNTYLPFVVHAALFDPSQLQFFGSRAVVSIVSCFCGPD